jgi:ParB-like chromosome segregation protein Spo0J
MGTKTPARSKSNNRQCLPIGSLTPARMNDKVYKPVRDDDPEIVELSKSIKEHGVLDSIVITTDNAILSGHRRYAAAKLAGLTEVPVKVHPILSTDPKFLPLLVDFNLQRDKTPNERINEEVIRTSPDDAHAELSRLRAERMERSLVGAKKAGLSVIDAAPARRRSEIGPGKQQMLAAVLKVLEENKTWWPLSVRQVHYRLLNDPPPRNTGQGSSTGTYRNDVQSYKDLCDLLTRARLAGTAPWGAICDETRPISIWTKWPNVGKFVQEWTRDLFGEYRRDYLQSQPAHIEIVAEKQTVQAIVERAAIKYHANVMVGRGFSSITARHDLVERFQASGKGKLILLVLSDFDPEGESIADTLTSSIRDEFGVHDVQSHKVALTKKHVDEMSLPPGGKAKKTSSRYDSFVERFGDDVYELEALPPAQLEQLIVDVILAVVDRKCLDHEMAMQKKDDEELHARRQVVIKTMGPSTTV